jgi:hypothetical protein
MRGFAFSLSLTLAAACVATILFMTEQWLGLYAFACGMGSWAAIATASALDAKYRWK